MSDPSNTGGNLSPEQLAARDAQIEADFCAGIKPLRQIGKEHGLSHTAVAKHCKARGLVRDLGAKIRALADAKVAKAAVSSEVAKAKAATEAQVVEVNATLQKQIRLEHRQDIQRGRRLFATLMSELESTTPNVERLEELYDVLNEPPEGATKGQLDAINKGRELLAKVISHPSRVDSFKRLTETLEKLVRMERQAFGISDEDSGEGGDGGSGAGPARGRPLTDVERAVRLAHLMAQMQSKPPAEGAAAA